MHVLLIPSWYPTDDDEIAGIFFKEQAMALSRRIHDVGVIAPRLVSLKDMLRTRNPAIRKISYKRDSNLKTYDLSDWNWSYKFRRGRVRHWLRLGESLFERYVAEQGKPDLIHAHCALLGGLLARRIKEKYGIPFVLTEHNTAFSRNLYSSYEKNLCFEVFKSSNVNIAVSPSLSTLLSKHFPSSLITWRWIPNCLSYKFERDSSMTRLKHANSLPNPCKKSRFRFINVATLTPKKGHADLIEAFSSAFLPSENVELYIAGDGPLKGKLERQVKNKGLTRSIFFLGKLGREQVFSEMLKSDAFVLSSRYETFGIVLIEALACGKPIIATACGGPECIVTPENGFLVEKQNKSEMVSALQSMRNDIGKFDAFGIRGNCMARFSSLSVTSELMKIYRSLI